MKHAERLLVLLAIVTLLLLVVMFTKMEYDRRVWRVYFEERLDRIDEHTTPRGTP